MGLSRYVKKAAKIAGYTPFTGFGAVNQLFSHGGASNPMGSLANMLRIETPAMKGEAKDAANAAESSALAAAKQAEFEASQRSGIAALALKRRRGFAGSMIASRSTLGSGSSLGA